MNRHLISKRVKFLLILLTLMVVSTACGGPALPLRSDMGTDGLESVVTYNLKGPAGTEQEVNMAELRGVNANAPRLQLRTVFGKLSGSKTQDVTVVLPDGVNAQALGMIKTKRFAGLTNFMTVEPATYSVSDAKGKLFCGAKVRLDFNRNLQQYLDLDRRDFQTLWYYTIPCAPDQQGMISLDLEKAQLYALVVNEVWQARIAWGSYFFNWGHSVTSLGGLPATWPGGWWTHMDVPNSDYDAMGAANLINDLVNDLGSSEQPWVEYTTGGKFATSGAYLIYSAADADRYATWERTLLNRQREYAVFYRATRESPWDFITIKPVYNYEFNDIGQVWANAKGWGKDPFSGRLNEQGLPKTADDDVIAEMERVGFMNAPNTALEQIQFVGRDGQILYVMTVRAYVGANDTLIMFGRVKPDLGQIRQMAPQGETLPIPVLYDNTGKKLPEAQQPYTDQQWAAFQREATIWNFLKDNPSAIGADLMIQYRFADNTTWEAIPCSDGGTCGYEPIEWNLSTSYYFDGQVRNAWLIGQLLGEVGVRTLGMSYASGRYEGTGLLFGMAQKLFLEEYTRGFTVESLWRLDARASQLPQTLAEAWAVLFRNP